MQALLDAREHSRTVSLALEAERQAAVGQQRALTVEQERVRKAQDELAQERNRPFYKRAWFWGGAAAVVGIALGVSLGIYGYQLGQSRTDGGTVHIDFYP